MGSKLKEMTAIHCTLNSLLTQTAADRLRFVKQKLFDKGDKPGKYLAYLTRKQMPSHTIASGIDAKGACNTNPEVIDHSFRVFQMNVYQSEQSEDAQTIMKPFFSQA